MVRVDYMGHPRQAPPRSHEQQEEVRIAVPVQEERPSTCQHVHQRLSRCSRPQKLPRCSGLTRKQSPAGQRLASSHRSGPSAVTAGTGRQRFARFSRASRSSARNETWPQPSVAELGGLVRDAAHAASGHSSSSWGGRPRRPAHRIGGRASRRCDVGHRSADVAGVDPASSGKCPGGSRKQLRENVLPAGTRRPCPAWPAPTGVRSGKILV
jgi:hypothetical protein